MNIQMVPVESSNIVAVGWSNGNLRVQFRSGGTYIYYDVPKEAFEELLGAESVGRYLAANIKPNYGAYKEPEL